MKLLKNQIFLVKKWEIQIIVSLIKITRFSDMIFNPIRYTGIIYTSRVYKLNEYIIFCCLLKILNRISNSSKTFKKTWKKYVMIISGMTERFHTKNVAHVMKCLESGTVQTPWLMESGVCAMESGTVHCVPPRSLQS